MYLLGLTGPIASGKSTVAKMFAATGAPVVDADKVVHRLLGSGTAEASDIADRLGDGVVAADGSIKRAEILSLAMLHSDVLETVEQILHPAVRREIKAELARLAGSRLEGADAPPLANTPPLAVLEVPLMYTSGFDRLVDSVCVCHCNSSKRHRRALEDRGMEEAVWHFLNQRQVKEAREAAALGEHQIRTDVPLEVTEAEVVRLAETLRQVPAHAWPGRWTGIR